MKRRADVICGFILAYTIDAGLDMWYADNTRTIVLFDLLRDILCIILNNINPNLTDFFK